MDQPELKDFVKKVKVCRSSREGEELLKTVGEQTHGLCPTLNFVPWIVFNQVSTNIILSLFIVRSRWKNSCDLHLRNHS